MSLLRSSYVFPEHWRPVAAWAPAGGHADDTAIEFEAQLPGDAGTLRLRWDERDQRRGRQPQIVDCPLDVQLPAWRWVGFELGDISWWVGAWYAVGAVLWITNASLAAWPTGQPDSDALTLGLTSVLGAVLFQLGAICQMWEAANSERKALFGFSVDLLQRRLVAEVASRTKCLPAFGSGAVVYSAFPALERQVSVLLPAPHSSLLPAAARAGLGLAPHDSLGLRVLRCASAPAGLAAAHEQQQQQQQQAHAGVRIKAGWYAFPDFNVGNHSHSSASCHSHSRSPSAVSRRWGSYPQQQRSSSMGSSRASPLPAPALAPKQQQQHLPPPPQQQGAAPNVEQPANASPARQQYSGSAASRSPFFEAGHWVWLSWRPRELGWLGALVQVIGTSVFLVACVIGFPGVLPTELEAGDWKLWDACYWTPFLVGSCLFIASAAIWLVEVQDAWWKPAPRRLAWWLNLLNLIGSIGFWLCSFFGFFAYPAQKYQRWGMAFSTVWGSACFLASAYLQMLEVLNRYSRPMFGGSKRVIMRVEGPSASFSSSLSGDGKH